MTDTLIARLRDGNLFADRVEAADRIEALHAENARIGIDAAKEIVKLRAEVERLTAITQAAPFHNGNSAEHWNKLAVMRYQENCALQSSLTALEGQKPEFWWRPFDDGSYLGPLHDDSIEEVRKLSQEWKPLFVTAGAAPKEQT